MGDGISGACMVVMRQPDGAQLSQEALPQQLGGRARSWGWPHPSPPLPGCVVGKKLLPGPHPTAGPSGGYIDCAAPTAPSLGVEPMN